MRKKAAPVKRKLPHKIVRVAAIGASAGGLEAITALLKNLPANTGMAYVYIQHLDPTHKSMLSSILSKVTRMKVVEAKNQVRIAPNRLYIMPPDMDMVITDGVLKLRPRPAGKALHLPINQFFISLAERQKEAAIGIVLSGNGADGAIGLKAIKMAGGLTFAQDETAKFKSMPKAAVAENGVDLILPPAEIAKELEHLGKQANVFYNIINDKSEEEKPFDDALSDILILVKKSTGVDFSHYKKSTIKRRVMRRVLLHKQSNLKGYVQYLKQDTNEVKTLYQDLLINVTNFFRETINWDYLKKILLPRILKTKNANDPLRIWIPACSTGEEAYSMAILIMEILGETATANAIQIFATDLSDAAIGKARLGLYNKNDLLEISPKRLRRFFTKVDDKYRIAKPIRDLCVFAPHNIFKDPPFSRIDLISCCNLLIYLDTILQKKVIATFHYALNNNGYLILGKSETVGNSRNLFTLVDKKMKIYSRRNEASPRAVFDMTYRLPDTEKSTGAADKKNHKITSDVTGLEKTVDGILMERYAPACVVVNQELEILQFRGSTGLFLEPSPGKASFNLLKMARGGLAFELRNMIHKVMKSGEPFKKSGLEIKHKNNSYRVAIEVIPLNTAQGERNFLIVFEEMKMPLVAPDSGGSRDRRVKQLEQELAAAREDMRSIIEGQEAANEELQSANEEIVSSNEELQSINEELETSKEEVESTNEELLTINKEILMRNEQLAESYEYAETVFSTIREAVVLIDSDFRIKSVSKTFCDIFRVKEEDANGALIYELTNRQWDIPKLHLLLEDLIPKNSSINGFKIDHTFRGIGEKVMLINARKIIQKSHRQQLILFAIEDITEHALAARMIAEREAWLRNMANNLPSLIWVAGTDKKRTFFNNTWLQFTGRNMEDETGSGWIGDLHKDDVNNFLNIYNGAFENQEPFRIEYRLRRNDGEYRWILSVGKPTYDNHGVFTGFLGNCTEIHDQRVINAELEKKVKERTEALMEVNTRLERSNRELEQFAYVASHDLQEPLRKILTFGDRLQQRFKTDIPEEGAIYLDKISQSAERMTRLIDDLLNFSKISKYSEQFKETDLNDSLQEVLKNFEVDIHQKKVTINLSKLPVIQAVPVQMIQLFYNIISNALKFSAHDMPLVITVTSHLLSDDEAKNYPALRNGQEYYEIVIKDNGIGFQPAFAEKIFVIFQRLHEKDKYPGTGIGLALCKKIVDSHGGIIFAKSKEGEGAEFHIILPSHKNGENSI